MVDRGSGAAASCELVKTVGPVRPGEVFDRETNNCGFHVGMFIVFPMVRRVPGGLPRVPRPVSKTLGPMLKYW
jgi:hypothetical protein